MADFTIRVREKSRPTVVFAGTTAWKDRSNLPQDITGWVLKLAVKPTFDAPDSEVIFDLTATLGADPTQGEFYFAMTQEQTCLAPGTYPAEIRVWSSGSTSLPPHDGRSVDFVVEPAIKIVE